MDELVVSRQSEHLDSEDIMVSKPMGILFWLAIGWVGLVVLLAVLANLLPLPRPQLPELHGRQRPTQHPPPARAPTTWAATC